MVLLADILCGTLLAAMVLQHVLEHCGRRPSSFSPQINRSFAGTRAGTGGGGGGGGGGGEVITVACHVTPHAKDTQTHVYPKFQS